MSPSRGVSAIIFAVILSASFTKAFNASGISPAIGSIFGSQVQISGSGFLSATTVQARLRVNCCGVQSLILVDATILSNNLIAFSSPDVSSLGITQANFPANISLVFLLPNGSSTQTSAFEYIYFDPRTTLVTSLSPTSGLSFLPMTITIFGINLPTQSAAVCVFTGLKDTEVTFSASILGLGNASCIVPPLNPNSDTVAKGTIGVSLRLGNELLSSQLAFTFVTAAPEPQTLRFTELGNQLDLFWDHPVEPRPQDCVNIFSSSSMALIGSTNASCTWISWRELLVTLPESALVKGGDRLSLQSGVFRRKGANLLQSLSYSQPFTPPIETYSLPTVLVVEAPSAIPVCFWLSPILVPLQLASGRGYSKINVVGNFDHPSFKFIWNVSTSIGQIMINGSVVNQSNTLPPSTRLSLFASSVLGNNATFSASFSVASNIPLLTVDGGLSQSLALGKALSLGVTIERGCLTDAGILHAQLEWIVLDGLTGIARGLLEVNSFGRYIVPVINEETAKTISAPKNISILIRLSPNNVLWNISSAIAVCIDCQNPTFVSIIGGNRSVLENEVVELSLWPSEQTIIAAEWSCAILTPTSTPSACNASGVPIASTGATSARILWPSTRGNFTVMVSTVARTRAGNILRGVTYLFESSGTRVAPQVLRPFPIGPNVYFRGVLTNATSGGVMRWSSFSRNGKNKLVLIFIFQGHLRLKISTLPLRALLIVILKPTRHRLAR
jgi:hypothetical protein